MKRKNSQGAIAAMRPETPELNSLLAMFGKAVNVPQGRDMAEIAIQCAHWKDIDANTGQTSPLDKERDATKRQRWLAPRLAALLSDALMELDAIRFDEFAAVIRAVKKQGTDRRQNGFFPMFHSKALQLASQVRQENLLARNAPLPITQFEFLRRVDSGTRRKIEAIETKAQKDRCSPNELRDTLHNDLSRERRDLARLGIRFASIGGRPRKNRGSQSARI